VLGEPIVQCQLWICSSNACRASLNGREPATSAPATPHSAACPSLPCSECPAYLQDLEPQRPVLAEVDSHGQKGQSFLRIQCCVWVFQGGWLRHAG
jgi:hypothetical protein